VCTLVLARDVFPGHPLVVAANRDELLARPSAGPSLWPESIPFIAPKDLQAGGTWIGYSACGVLVAVTNRRLPAASGGARTSRGRLVVEALAHSTAALAAEHIGAAPGERYDGFHLVIADRAGAFLVWGDGASIQRRAIEPGLHVVTQLGFDGESPRDAAIRERVALMKAPTPEALRSLLTIHGPTPLDGTCVHADEVGYGTRSSTVLLADASGKAELFWGEGHPCTGELTPVVFTASRF
jgi:uncharacterized protein with NRDE domain